MTLDHKAYRLEIGPMQIPVVSSRRFLTLWQRPFDCLYSVGSRTQKRHLYPLYSWLVLCRKWRFSIHKAYRGEMQYLWGCTRICRKGAVHWQVQVQFELTYFKKWVNVRSLAKPDDDQVLLSVSYILLCQNVMTCPITCNHNQSHYLMQHPNMTLRSYHHQTLSTWCWTKNDLSSHSDLMTLSARPPKIDSIIPDTVVNTEDNTCGQQQHVASVENTPDKSGSNRYQTSSQASVRCQTNGWPQTTTETNVRIFCITNNRKHFCQSHFRCKMCTCFLLRRLWNSPLHLYVSCALWSISAIRTSFKTHVCQALDRKTPKIWIYTHRISTQLESHDVLDFLQTRCVATKAKWWTACGWIWLNLKLFPLEFWMDHWTSGLYPHFRLKWWWKYVRRRSLLSVNSKLIVYSRSNPWFDDGIWADCSTVLQWQQQTPLNESKTEEPEWLPCTTRLQWIALRLISLIRLVLVFHSWHSANLIPDAQHQQYLSLRRFQGSEH